jgi:geranylgeranyl diphosphate synthase, type I
MSGSDTTRRNAFLELLGRLRPELDRRIDERYEAVAQRARPHGPQVAAMVDAARDLALRGGKRLRAGLIAAGWLAAGGDEDLDAAIDGGVAFELLQTYLLIQDDWMDGDMTRRGGPSVHAALTQKLEGEQRGASSAILASDLTWSLSVETLLGIQRISPETRIEVLSAFLRVHEDVVLGQQIDILGASQDVEAMHDLKTGSYTIRGPLVLGATMAGGSSELRAFLTRFAAPLGIAFQLRDDLLGTFGDPAETGKPVGNDILVGKRTALMVEAERRANDEERRAIANAWGRLGAPEAAVAAATAALVSSGARRAVEERQAALCASAQELLDEVGLDAAVRPILAGIVDALKVST